MDGGEGEQGEQEKGEQEEEDEEVGRRSRTRVRWTSETIEPMYRAE